MSKALGVVVIATLAVILAGCGGTKTSQTIPVAAATGATPSAIPSHTPAAPASKAPSGHVDLTLGEPLGGRILARTADGRTLLAIMAWLDQTKPEERGHALHLGSMSYFAVLDPKNDCVEETFRFPTLIGAGLRKTADEALRDLASDQAKAEIHTAWNATKRFGLRTIGPVAFGKDEGTTFVEGDYGLLLRTAAGAFRQHAKTGSAKHLVPSNDRTKLAFSTCQTPCNYRWEATVLDVAADTLQRYPIGGVHQVDWSPDDTSITFTYDDAKPIPPGGAAQNACIGRIDVGNPKATTLACTPSIVFSEEISALSANQRYLALKVMQLRTNGSAFAIFELPGAREVARVDAASLSDIDDKGRIVFDERRGDRRHRAVLAGVATTPQIFPDTVSIGFLADGSVLGIPWAETDDPKHPRIATLEKKHCGLFVKRP